MGFFGTTNPSDFPQPSIPGVRLGAFSGRSAVLSNDGGLLDIPVSTCQAHSQISMLSNGQLNTALDDARADGVAGEASGVVDVEFLHEMSTMLLDGLDADAEFRRSFLVGFALGH